MTDRPPVCPATLSLIRETDAPSALRIPVRNAGLLPPDEVSTFLGHKNSVCVVLPRTQVSAPNNTHVEVLKFEDAEALMVFAEALWKQSIALKLRKSGLPSELGSPSETSPDGRTSESDGASAAASPTSEPSPDEQG